MKKVTFVLMLILFSNFVLAVSSSSPYNFLTRSQGDILYCQQGGNCNLSNLVVGNLSVIDQFINITVVNYNVTGNLNVQGNVTANYFIGNGSLLTDLNVSGGGITIDQNVNTTANVTFNNIDANEINATLFRGQFLWFIELGLSQTYLQFNNTHLAFNESQLNDTIDARAAPGIGGGYQGDQPYLFNDSTTMFFNESKLNDTIDDTGEGLFLRKNSDSLDIRQYYLNYSFTNVSAPVDQNSIAFTVLQTNASGAGVISVENDINTSSLLFVSGSNFSVDLGLNNSAGLATVNADLTLAVREPDRNIIMQVINSTGQTINSLIVQGDGDVLLQGTLLFEDENKTIKSEMVNGGSALVFEALEVLSGGETPFVWKARNSSGNLIIPLALQNGLNNSGGYWRNSMIVGGDQGRNNTANLTSCIQRAVDWGIPPRVLCDTQGTGSDLLLQDSFQLGGTVFAETGIRGESIANFIMNGNDFLISNGSLLIQTPTNFTTGFAAGEEARLINEPFAVGIGVFSNQQDDTGNWVQTSSGNCGSSPCAFGTSAGDGTVRMTTQISTSNFENCNITFTYSILKDSGPTLSVIVDNNEGTSSTIFSESPSNSVTLQEAAEDFPATMDNRTLVNVTFEHSADEDKPDDQSYVDTVVVRCTANISTQANVTSFDGEICYRDGLRDVNGDCNTAWFYDAETNQMLLRGATLNASGTITGGISGTGTTNNVAKFTATTAIGNSQIVDDGSTIEMGLITNMTAGAEVNGNLKVFGGDFVVNNSNLFVDSSAGRVGIGTTSPNNKLEVVGDINVTGDINASGRICDSTGCIVLDTNESVRVLELETGLSGNSSKLDALRIDHNNNVTKIDTTWNGLVGNATKLDNLVLGNTTQEMINAVNGTALNGENFTNLPVGGNTSEEIRDAVNQTLMKYTIWVNNSYRWKSVNLEGACITPGTVATCNGGNVAEFKAQASANIYRYFNDSYGGEARANQIDTMNVISNDDSIIINAQNGGKTKDNLTFAYNYTRALHTFFGNISFGTGNQLLIANDEFAFCSASQPLACMGFETNPARYTLQNLVGADQFKSMTGAGDLWALGTMNATSFYGQVFPMIASAGNDGDALCDAINGTPTTEHRWTCQDCYNHAGSSAGIDCTSTTGTRQCMCLSKN